MWPSGNPAHCRVARSGFDSPLEMSVGAPAVLSGPCFFLSKRGILPRAVGQNLTSPPRGTGAPKVPGRWSPFFAPPSPPHHLHERLYLLKPLAPPISFLVQRNGRAHGRTSRPASPVPCTNPIPLALHTHRWPCGPVVTPHTAEWQVLGSTPPLACQSALRRCFLFPVSFLPSVPSSPGR